MSRHQTRGARPRGLVFVASVRLSLAAATGLAGYGAFHFVEAGGKAGNRAIEASEMANDSRFDAESAIATAMNNAPLLASHKDFPQGTWEHNGKFEEGSLAKVDLEKFSNATRDFDNVPADAWNAQDKVIEETRHNPEKYASDHKWVMKKLVQAKALTGRANEQGAIAYRNENSEAGNVLAWLGTSVLTIGGSIATAYSLSGSAFPNRRPRASVAQPSSGTRRR